MLLLLIDNNKAWKINYLYDELNRLAKVTLLDSGKVEFNYDASNRVIERINANDTGTEYTYTLRSEVESIINYQDRRHGRDQVIGSYGYIYNAKGQRIYQVEGNGNLTAYTYDPTGRIKEVYYPFNDKKKVEDLKERYTYGLLPEYDEPCKFKLKIPNLYWNDLANLEQQIKEFNDFCNNGFNDDNKHGKNKGPKEVELSGGHNNLPFINNLNLDYQDRSKIENLFQKVREGHEYLDLRKGFWKETYTYDPNGNITKKQNGWGEISYQYNQANQLSQVGKRTYQYDPNGNLIKEVLSNNFIDYQYNFENRLVKVNNKFKHWISDPKFAGEVSYGYDALGRKVKKEVDPLYGSKNETETEYYIYNGLGLDILADYQYESKQYGRYGDRGELDRINEYYYGNGMLLASKEFDGSNRGHWDRDPLKNVSFYHQDILGSVVLVTDRNGHVDESYQYDVWGKIYEGKFEDGFPGYGQKGNVYGFTGQRFEAELGVYAFPYRDYNPRTMRWMTEDPIKDGLNWSQYCYSNPIKFIDPFGLEVYVGTTHPTPEITVPSLGTSGIEFTMDTGYGFTYRETIVPSLNTPEFNIAPESNHTFIIITDKPIDQADPLKSNVLEAGPSNPLGFGTLEIQRYNDPKDVIANPEKYNLQEVPTPNGLSLSEFQKGIENTFYSYDNVSHPPYFGLPDLDPTGNCRNSNSFTGSILRENGSDWKPDYWSPGWDLQVNFHCSGN